MWIYLAARNAGTPKDWSRTVERAVLALPASPSAALPLDPTVPQRYLHSPTTRPIKQTELFPRIRDASKCGTVQQFFSEKARRQGDRAL